MKPRAPRSPAHHGTFVIPMISRLSTFALLTLAAICQSLASPTDEELVRQLSRPVPSETVLPFQNDWDFRMGPLDQGSRYKLSFEPVIPVALSRSWNLIVRTSVPYVAQEDVFKTGSTGTASSVFPGLPGIDPNGAYPVYEVRPLFTGNRVIYRRVQVGFATGAELIAKAKREFGTNANSAKEIVNHHQDGLSDIVQSFYLSPGEPVGGWDLGFGPALLYPSATDDRLGSEKWAAGPTAFVVKQTAGWTYGVLANHLWSFAGNEDRRSVNATYVRPFIAYSTKSNMTFSVNAESTYDWNESQWLVPVNLTVAQLVRIGSVPVQFQVGARYYAEGPSGAPEWGLRFTVTPIFAGGEFSSRAALAKSMVK